MKKLIIFTACALSLASCKKYLDVNQNPNAPTEVPAKVLLPNTSIGIGWANANELGRASSVLVQYNAGAANSALGYDTYVLAGSFENQWNYEIYNGVVNNLQLIIQKSDANVSGYSPAYGGIAKIQLAYIISMATDLWGAVPYSQAGQGLAFTQPRYDSTQDIYQGNAGQGIVSLFDLVKSGIADLKKTTALKPGADDVIYNGDLTKWIKAGNTLILKFANTVSNVNPALATTNINAVLASADGYINDSSLDLQVPFSATIGNQNPMYVQDISGGFKNGEMLSTRLLALSKSLNDTVRLAKFYTKPKLTAFVGYENGANIALPLLATRSNYNTYVVGTAGEAPVRLLTNFQVKFILAESVVKLGIAGNANQYFQDGIKASMTKAGMTAAEITQYFTTNPGVVTLSGTPEDMVKQIITQKYLAWVGNGFEAYNDYRRTGYPQLALALNVTGGDNPSQIPKRFPYTPSETNSNPNQPNPRPKTDVKIWWAL
jgi:hypothetical protein